MPSGKPVDICGAWIKRKETHCGLPKGWGTTHPGSGRCKWHFGNTKTGRESAAKEAGAKLMKYVSPIEIDPTAALLQELYRTAGHVAWLDAKISGWSMDTDEEIPPNQEQWLKVHREERTHMVRVAKTALDAGIAERQVQLAEQQGMILASAIDAILSRMQLSPAQQAMIPQVVPEVLRAVAVRVGELSDGG